MIRKVLPLRHGLLAAIVPAFVAISSFSPVCAQPAPPTARPLAPLSSVKVPLPENIDEFVRDRAAAVALGKALFWDMQVGSDGKTACATCHFHAGADGRFVNTLSLPKKSPSNAKLTSVLTKLKTSDFPFTRISGNNPLDPAAVVVSSRGEIVGSKGVELRTFQSIQPYSSVDIGIKKSDPTFNFRGVNLRTVTARNTPSVINSAFNHRNNWDGRASFYFNGVNSYGKFDADATVTQVSFAYRTSTDAYWIESPAVADARSITCLASKYCFPMHPWRRKRSLHQRQLKWAGRIAPSKKSAERCCCFALWQSKRCSSAIQLWLRMTTTMEPD